jgi:hypothetical protein
MFGVIGNAAFLLNQCENLRLALVRILAPSYKASRSRTKGRQANNETTAIWNLAWEVGVVNHSCSLSHQTDVSKGVKTSPRCGYVHIGYAC